MKISAVLISLFLALLPCFTLLAAAETVNRDSGGKQLKLSLRTSILTALKNNLSIQISMITPVIGEKNVSSAESVFDPLFSVESSIDNNKQLSTFRFDGAEVETETVRMNGSLQKKLHSGASVKMGIENTRVYSTNMSNSFNPYVRNDLYLSLDQPLLRGFGKDINEMPIVIAVNKKRSDEYAFRAVVDDITFNVHELYWNLVFFRKQLNVDRLLLKRAENLLADNKEKVRVGVMAKIEVLQAEVGVSTRQEDIIKSNDKINEFEDKLRDVMNISRKSEYWLADIFPTDEPVIPQINLSESSAVKNALKNRPEIQQKRVEVENLKNQLLLAKNETLPLLSLQVKGTLHGLGKDFNNGMDELSSGAFHDLSFGMVFTYPLYNRDKKAVLLKRKLELERGKISLAKLENDIVFRVRGVLRTLKTEKKRIDVTRKKVELEEEQLDMEEEKLKVGLSTSHDVLQFQSELSLAKSSYLRAVSDYLIALADLEKLEGNILKGKNIELKLTR